MFGMVGCGATTRKGSARASRKRVTCAAASVVSPGGFGLLARTKSRRKAMIVSRSSSIHLASCRFTLSMTGPRSEKLSPSIHRGRLDRRGLLAGRCGTPDGRSTAVKGARHESARPGADRSHPCERGQPTALPRRRDDRVGDIYFSSVLGYNTQAFPSGKHPRSWAEFWDLKRFPGPRMLADLASGNVDLEFALLADGVAKDKLYPLDIERGFKSLDRVRSAIRKFWDTGALSAQMLADKEVVLGSIWNGRLQAVADKGAPLAIEWNEASLQSQYWGVLKGAKHAEDAQRFVDFACQPELQANLARLIPYGPTNRQAFKSIPADVAARLPSSPEYRP